MVGHRGAPALAPENTLSSLEAAIEAGADLVEFDVSPGLLLEHSPGEAGRDAVRLEQALELLRDRGVGAHVDVKLPGYEREVVELIAAHGLERRALLSTARPAVSRTLARLAPELPRAIGYPRDRYGLARLRWPDAPTRAGARALRAATPLRVPLLLRRARADHVALHHTLCSASAVAAAHRAGAAVIAWTVNDAASAVRLAALGVDALVSDDPGVVLGAVATLTTP
ncbi:MAG TPA: glycerophosphodiester phosphodiesterase [Gaiellaceae bacterium]|nr:glycerophosphodiester phosphodiesterase [Gaiellaceae bacterium]